MRRAGLTPARPQALFDDATVCKGDTSGDQRVCWKAANGTSWSSMNPWLLGYWNPYEECDVDFTAQTQAPVEYIDASCAPAVCPLGGPYFTNMPFSQQCQNRLNQRVLQPGVPQIDVFGNYLPYNLCHHRLVEDPEGCLHDQGLLGGFDGLPVGAGPGSRPMTADTPYAGARYVVSDDMYTPSEWEIPADFQGGLFAGTNPLWAGAEAAYGFLRVPPAELGVHRVGLRITRPPNSTYARLDVYKLPLATAAGEAGLDLDSPLLASRPVGEWVPGLLDAIRADARANEARRGFDAGNATSASCPLRRFAFHSSERTGFAPSMPSPLRARHLFGNITGRALAHPTMTQSTDGALLGPYRTVNGFCFCPVVAGVPQANCQVRIGSSLDPTGCSLTQTAQALLGGAPGTSYVFEPFTTNQRRKPCQMQLDWPRIPLPLRDGSAGAADFRLASDPASQRCHVLDRLRPFQYRYASAPEFPSPGPASHAGGVCQTRRVVRLPASVPDALGAGRCIRDALEADRALVRCAGVEGATPLPRLTRAAPRDTAAKAAKGRRTRCAACAPPPRFQTQGGAPMSPPESSFGRPFRLSAERAMAKDLRDAVCAGDAACPLLNRSAWRAGEFMRNLLTRPASLFRLNATAAGRRTAPAPPDDAPRWTDHGWVYCPDRPSLRTGEGCLGSIPRDVWQRSKTTVCPHMVRALSANGSQGGKGATPFFDIDRYTQAVNLAYQRAVALVERANCIAAGNFSCLPTPWAYHPASFEPSNQEWVYKTVLDYYRLVGPAACPLTPDEAGIAAINQLFLQSCPANAMRFFENILGIVRLVGTDLAYILSTLGSMAFKMATLLFAGLDGGLRSSIRVAQQQVAEDWQWVKHEARSMLAGVQALLIDMLFTSGQIGAQLLHFLTSVCGFVNQ